MRVARCHSTLRPRGTPARMRIPPRFHPLRINHANSQPRRLRPARIRRRHSAATIFGQRTDLETSRKVIHKAIDLGVTLFDTADIYAGMGGSETVLGAVLGDRPARTIVLATKYSKPMSKRRHQAGRVAALHHVRGRGKPDAAEDRLHRPLPAARLRSADTDRGERRKETLSRARRPGAARKKSVYIGNSNFPAWRIAEAEYVARQIKRQPLRLLPGRIQPRGARLEKDLLRQRKSTAFGLLPFFPLASGLLTGKYKRGTAAPEDTRFAKAPALKDRYATARNENIVEKLEAFAQARGHSMLELAVFPGWRRARMVSSVIAGATRVEQIEQNVKAIDWTLSAEELAEIDGITK